MKWLIVLSGKMTVLKEFVLTLWMSKSQNLLVGVCSFNVNVLITCWGRSAPAAMLPVAGVSTITRRPLSGTAPVIVNRVMTSPKNRPGNRHVVHVMDYSYASGRMETVQTVWRSCGDALAVILWTPMRPGQETAADMDRGRETSRRAEPARPCQPLGIRAQRLGPPVRVLRLVPPAREHARTDQPRPNRANKLRHYRLTTLRPRALMTITKRTRGDGRSHEAAMRYATSGA